MPIFLMAHSAIEPHIIVVSSLAYRTPQNQKTKYRSYWWEVDDDIIQEGIEYFVANFIPLPCPVWETVPQGATTSEGR